MLTPNGDGSFNVNSFDPDLKPERSQDANLLVAHRIGRVKLTGSVFYQRIRDTIFSVQGFNQFGVITSSFKNIDLTRQYGVELIAEAHDWPVALFHWFGTQALCRKSSITLLTVCPCAAGTRSSSSVHKCPCSAWLGTAFTCSTSEARCADSARAIPWRG